MTRNNTVNLDITNNAVGATIGGGATERYFAWNGTGNITLTQAYNGNTVFTLPSVGATDFLLGASAFTAAGTILYGNGVGTYPLALAAGTAGQFLQSNGATVGWASLALIFWLPAASATPALAENGYYVTSGNSAAITLPLVAAAGSALGVFAAQGSLGWNIVQGTGQSIQLGQSSTTPGAAGSVTSTATGDGLLMICTTANLTWLALQIQGNPVVA